ncbi:hypothetical protein CONPUDRAFT_61139, partial [Coniophora puteana RWD-64-598 SS2]
ISKYIAALDDRPMARKLEALLGSFNRQLHLDQVSSLKETQITQYFVSHT